MGRHFHGSAHLTNDLDVCYSRDRENVRRLVDALTPYHPRPRSFPEEIPFIWDASTLANGTIFTLTTDLGAIDLLAEVAGIGDYQDAFAASLEVDVFDRRVHALDLPSLIRSKKAAGRVKDLLVLPELESLLESQSE